MFFSDNKIFAAIIMVVTFVDFYTGVFGLISVLITNIMSSWIGFDKDKTQHGFYGFNSLLVGLGLGVYFSPGLLLFFIVLLASVLTLFVAVSLEGVIGKYLLPYLSIPFLLSIWLLTIASREFQSLGLNERGIYTLNDLYIIGGDTLVRMYEWWNSFPLPSSVRTYLLSLGAIFFQYNVLAGLVLAIGLLIYSRIAFTLSLLGFYTAFLFYQIIGADISEVIYSYIGFNYILTAIAIGGFFIIPNRSSYLWVVLLIPIVAIFTISLSTIFAPYGLAIYSLPFNMISLLFLYVLKFRLHNKAKLNAVIIQQNSPEKNLYSFVNFTERFGKNSPIPIYLPFHGTWSVTQGHNGDMTHKSAWQHAWDFEITDELGTTFKNTGDYHQDYFCFDKSIIAPADGIIEEVLDFIPDNIIGEKNLEKNWGNTIVIKHSEYLYSQLSHLKSESIKVKKGDNVKKGDVLAKCGNSGNSPFPHLHFQIQATPYIGSKTLDYPISNYYLQNNDGVELKTVDIPIKNDSVSNIQPNAAMRKAFNFIVGEKLQFEVLDNDEHNAEWEIKIDFALNKYIECTKSLSKAYFRFDDSVFYFTHFEGDKESLLYNLYLAAYKVCLGIDRNMGLTDLININTAFRNRSLIIQDFIAPFYRYKKAEYNLKYSNITESFADTCIVLDSSVCKKNMGKTVSETIFQITVDNRGIKEFIYHKNQNLIIAKCINN